MTRATHRRALGAAILVFMASCLLSEGGLLTRRPWGDVGQYEHYARLLLDGKIPYHDYYLEYPPGALLAFVPPAIVTANDYLLVFKVYMALVGIVGLWLAAWVLRRLEATAERTIVALGVIAISPLALGHVFLNRFDVLPATLSLAAVAAILVGRARAGGILLSVGFAVKVFAFAAAPVAAIRLSRAEGTRALRRAVVAAILTGVAIFFFFLVVAFGGLGNTYWTQGKRGLQIESVGASILLAADRVGIGHARSAIDSPGSIDLGGTNAHVVAQLTTLIQIAAVIAVAIAYWRRHEGAERFVAAFAAAVAAFMVFGKVLSPQFLVWIVFLVPLVGGRWRRSIAALLVAALVLTQIELHGYVGLEIEDWAAWIVLARNALLVAIFALVLATVLDEAEPDRRAQ